MDITSKNHGNELERARDLFYALWIPDLFMKRVEAGKKKDPPIYLFIFISFFGAFASEGKEVNEFFSLSRLFSPTCKSPPAVKKRESRPTAGGDGSVGWAYGAGIDPYPGERKS